MSHVSKLRDVRKALQEGRFDLAESLLSTMKDRDFPSDALCRREIAGELSQIRALSRAAATGLSRARDEVRQLLGAARRLETYDRDGARQVEVTAPAPVRRF